jgi:hypothetical protein
LSFFWAIGLTMYCACAATGWGDNSSIAHNENAKEKNAKENAKENVKAV